MTTKKPKGRTIRIKVFKFDELDQRAQQKAMDWYREGNLDYKWWDGDYERFKSLCAYMGIEVDLKKTYFNGFYMQGSGSSFTGDIPDVAKCIKAIQAKSWKKDFTELDLDFPTPPKHMERVLRLIDQRLISYACDVESSNREISIRVNHRSEYEGDHRSDMSNVSKCLDELETYIEEIAQALNSWFYNLLKEDYEYLNSDEQVKESITANEYEFKIDGSRF